MIAPHSETATLVTCKNCGSLVENAYCPSCGQARQTGRLTFRNIGHELVEQLTNMDRGFLHTIKDLTVRPGHMCREYLLGKRKFYMKPLQFYLIMLALYFLFSEWLEIDPMESGRHLSDSLGAANSPPKQKEMSDKISQLMSSNVKFILSAMIPIQALCLRIFYRKSGVYFVEWLVFSLFITGYLYLFNMVDLIGMLGWGNQPSVVTGLTVLMIVSSVVYSTWAVVQFVQQRGIKAIGKAMVVILSSYFLYILASGLAGVLLVLLNKS